MADYELIVDYVDQRGICGLLDQIERGTLGQLSGLGAGGGFLSILSQAKLSGGPSRAQNSRTENAAEPYEQLDRIIRRLRAQDDIGYFESLDEAFASAPEAQDGCVWVYVRDRFTLTNHGGVGVGLAHNPPFEKLKSEQRFVFEIDPVRCSCVDRDDYFKRPRRPWRLHMSASFGRCPRQKWRRSWIDSNESVYFHWHHFIEIPLNVFGAYFRSGLQVMIIPYAIWA